MKTLQQFLIETSQSNIASSAYSVNYAKVMAEIAKLQRNVEAHKAEFDSTDQKDWGYSGDLAYVAEKLAELNEFMDSDNRS